MFHVAEFGQNHSLNESKLIVSCGDACNTEREWLVAEAQMANIVQQLLTGPAALYPGQCSFDCFWLSLANPVLSCDLPPIS